MKWVAHPVYPGVQQAFIGGQLMLESARRPDGTWQARACWSGHVATGNTRAQAVARLPATPATRDTLRQARRDSARESTRGLL